MIMRNRYRLIYGETHDTVHIRDDETSRRFIGQMGAIDELNELNEIIDALLYFIKEEGNELVRVEDERSVRWFVTTPEDVVGYFGEATVMTYDKYLESLKR